MDNDNMSECIYLEAAVRNVNISLRYMFSLDGHNIYLLFVDISLIIYSTSTNTNCKTIA